MWFECPCCTAQIKFRSGGCLFCCLHHFCVYPLQCKQRLRRAIGLTTQNSINRGLRNAETLGESDLALVSGLLDLDKQFSGGTKIHGFALTVIQLCSIYTMMNSFVNPLLDSSLGSSYSCADNQCMNLATNLDEAMRDRGYKSQSALARDSGVPQPTINRILKGITLTPDLVTLQKLAATLDVDVEWLTHRAGVGPNSSKRVRKGLLSQDVNRLVERIIELEHRQPEMAAKLVSLFEQQVSVLLEGNTRPAATLFEEPEREAQDFLTRVKDRGRSHAARERKRHKS